MSQVSPASLYSLYPTNPSQSLYGNKTDGAGFYTIPQQPGARGAEPIPISSVYESLLQNRASGASAASFRDFVVGVMAKTPENLLYTLGTSRDLYNFKNPLGGGIGPIVQNDGSVTAVLYPPKGQDQVLDGQAYLRPGAKIYIPPSLR